VGLSIEGRAVPDYGAPFNFSSGVQAGVTASGSAGKLVVPIQVAARSSRVLRSGLVAGETLALQTHLTGLEYFSEKISPRIF
jgi:hypothetical protein